MWNSPPGTYQSGSNPPVLQKLHVLQIRGALDFSVSHHHCHMMIRLGTGPQSPNRRQGTIESASELSKTCLEACLFVCCGDANWVTL